MKSKHLPMIAWPARGDLLTVLTYSETTLDASVNRVESAIQALEPGIKSS
jgi:hypothetical protein